VNAGPDAMVIDLATRIQRRRDFAAHLSGYGAGLVVLAATRLVGADATVTAGTVALAWATALSFQHFRHVLTGPITPEDVLTEQHRLAAASLPVHPRHHEGA